MNTYTLRKISIPTIITLEDIEKLADICINGQISKSQFEDRIKKEAPEIIEQFEKNRRLYGRNGFKAILHLRKSLLEEYNCLLKLNNFLQEQNIIFKMSFLSKDEYCRILMNYRESRKDCMISFDNEKTYKNIEVKTCPVFDKNTFEKKYLEDYEKNECYLFVFLINEGKFIGFWFYNIEGIKILNGFKAKKLSYYPTKNMKECYRPLCIKVGTENEKCIERDKAHIYFSEMKKKKLCNYISFKYPESISQEPFYSFWANNA